MKKAILTITLAAILAPLSLCALAPESSLAQSKMPQPLHLSTALTIDLFNSHLANPDLKIIFQARKGQSLLFQATLDQTPVAQISLSQIGQTGSHVIFETEIIPLNGQEPFSVGHTPIPVKWLRRIEHFMIGKFIHTSLDRYLLTTRPKAQKEADPLAEKIKEKELAELLEQQEKNWRIYLQKTKQKETYPFFKTKDSSTIPHNPRELTAPKHDQAATEEVTTQKIYTLWQHLIKEFHAAKKEKEKTSDAEENISTWDSILNLLTEVVRLNRSLRSPLSFIEISVQIVYSAYYIDELHRLAKVLNRTPDEESAIIEQARAEFNETFQELHKNLVHIAQLTKGIVPQRNPDSSVLQDIEQTLARLKEDTEAQDTEAQGLSLIKYMPNPEFLLDYRFPPEDKVILQQMLWQYLMFELFEICGTNPKTIVLSIPYYLGYYQIYGQTLPQLMETHPNTYDIRPEEIKAYPDLFLHYLLNSQAMEILNELAESTPFSKRKEALLKHLITIYHRIKRLDVPNKQTLLEDFEHSLQLCFHNIFANDLEEATGQFTLAAEVFLRAFIDINLPPSSIDRVLQALKNPISTSDYFSLIHHHLSKTCSSRGEHPQKALAAVVRYLKAFPNDPISQKELAFSEALHQRAEYQKGLIAKYTAKLPTTAYKELSRIDHPDYYHQYLRVLYFGITLHPSYRHREKALSTKTDQDLPKIIQIILSNAQVQICFMGTEAPIKQTLYQTLLFLYQQGLFAKVSAEQINRLFEIFFITEQDPDNLRQLLRTFAAMGVNVPAQLEQLVNQALKHYNQPWVSLFTADSMSLTTNQQILLWQKLAPAAPNHSLVHNEWVLFLIRYQRLQEISTQIKAIRQGSSWRIIRAINWVWERLYSGSPAEQIAALILNDRSYLKISSTPSESMFTGHPDQLKRYMAWLQQQSSLETIDTADQTYVIVPGLKEHHNHKELQTTTPSEDKPITYIDPLYLQQPVPLSAHALLVTGARQPVASSNRSMHLKTQELLSQTALSTKSAQLPASFGEYATHYPTVQVIEHIAPPEELQLANQSLQALSYNQVQESTITIFVHPHFYHLNPAAQTSIIEHETLQALLKRSHPQITNLELEAMSLVLLSQIISSEQLQNLAQELEKHILNTWPELEADPAIKSIVRLLQYLNHHRQELTSLGYTNTNIFEELETLRSAPADIAQVINPKAIELMRKSA